MASIMVECGAANYACAVTSSHFCTAERQFRTPLEYGSQRAPTAQWTAKASGSAVLGMSGDIQVRHATVGRIVDLGVTDMTNMGAAMAPAAAQTLLDFFNDTATKPEDYDRIYTGDLGAVGTKLLYELLRENGIVLRNHEDCGLILFDREAQDLSLIHILFCTTVFHTAFMRLFPEASAFFSASSTRRLLERSAWR